VLEKKCLVLILAKKYLPSYNDSNRRNDLSRKCAKPHKRNDIAQPHLHSSPQFMRSAGNYPGFLEWEVVFPPYGTLDAFAIVHIVCTRLWLSMLSTPKEGVNHSSMRVSRFPACLSGSKRGIERGKPNDENSLRSVVDLDSRDIPLVTLDFGRKRLPGFSLRRSLLLLTL
jgi:hypothetical protein